jgi:hypothetical protein
MVEVSLGSFILLEALDFPERSSPGSVVLLGVLFSWECCSPQSFSLLSAYHSPKLFTL